MTTIDKLYVKKIEAENDALRAQVERLEHRIAEMRDALGAGNLEAPMCFELTKREEQMFGVLMRREVATKEAFLSAMYGGGLFEPHLKIIDVFICKMRKKLRHFDIEISTLWGRGYFLTDQMKARVHEYYLVPGKPKRVESPSIAA